GLETLSRVNTLIFDKTGTITLGVPRVIEFKNHSKISDPKVLAIAQAIERNSLHPLAKAIVNFVKEKKIQVIHAQDITEEIGKGISGIVDRQKYTLSKIASDEGMEIGLLKGKQLIAYFKFEDQIKDESKEILEK